MEHAPRSDAALERYPAFVSAIRRRLEAGRAVYGDSSFERPITRLVEEIRQEVLDVAGWAFILYDRLEELESLIQPQVGPVEIRTKPD